MRLSVLRTPLLLAIAFAVLSSPLAYRLTRDMFGAWVSSAAGCSTPSGVALHALVFLGVAVALALSSPPAKEGFPSPPQGPLAILRPALFNRFTRRHRTKASKATLAWAKGMPRTQEIQTVFTGLDQDLSKWLQTIPSSGDGSYAITKMMYIQNPKIYSGNFAGKKLAGFTYLYVRYEGSMNGEALWFVPTLCAKGSTSGCTQGRMRVALYGGKPQILDMKDKNVTRMVPSKVSSAPTTTRTPSGSYVPDPSEYKVSPPPAGTTYTFIPADTTPPAGTTYTFIPGNTTHRGPFTVYLRRAPMYGYRDGKKISVASGYVILQSSLDELFQKVKPGRYISFFSDKQAGYYVFAVNPGGRAFGASPQKTPGQELRSVSVSKHVGDGKFMPLGAGKLKDYEFVMENIETSDTPPGEFMQLLTKTKPFLRTPAAPLEQQITVNTGSDRPSSTSLSPVPAEPEKKRLNISFKPVEKSALDGSLSLSDVPLYEPAYPVDQGPPTPTAAPASYETGLEFGEGGFAAY